VFWRLALAARQFGQLQLQCRLHLVELMSEMEDLLEQAFLKARLDLFLL
jgi:hypothetical protein